MATILSILGLVAQLKGSGFFGSSVDSSPQYFSSYPGFAQDYSSDVRGWQGVPFKK